MDDLDRAYLAVLALVLMDHYSGNGNNAVLSYSRVSVFTKAGKLFQTFSVDAISDTTVDMYAWERKEKIWNENRHTDLTTVREYRKYDTFSVKKWSTSLVEGQQPDGFYFKIEKMKSDQVRMTFRELETMRELLRYYTVKFS